jgi:protein gp37
MTDLFPAKRARTTGIEWTEHTWNPTVGCSIATAGCTNCYAMRQAHRIESFGTAPAYKGLTKSSKGGPVWTGKVAQASPASVRKPLGILEPAVIFVNSMSDLFHPDMDDKWRDDAFAIMVAAPRHTYQILTKRPEVAARYYAERPHLHQLPQVWLGVSVERADVLWRIDQLREIPVAIRFLSVEPLIGSVMPLNLDGIHWTITGGESGPGARPCKPQWFREVRDACLAAGVAYFHKQHGTWGNHPAVAELKRTVEEAKRDELDHHAKGGATLDGRLWRDFPVQH